MKQNFKKGFTLIELLVVIAIIGILAAITVVSVQGPRNKANDTKTLSNLRQTASVLEQYYGDTGGYPIITPAASEVGASWGALSTAVVAYGTPLPTSTNPIYRIRSTASGYCLWADTADANDTNMIRCKGGAQCATVTNAVGVAETPTCATD